MELFQIIYINMLTYYIQTRTHLTFRYFLLFCLFGVLGVFWLVGWFWILIIKNPCF